MVEPWKRRYRCPLRALASWSPAAAAAAAAGGSGGGGGGGGGVGLTVPRQSAGPGRRTATNPAHLPTRRRPFDNRCKKNSGVAFVPVMIRFAGFRTVENDCGTSLLLDKFPDKKDLLGDFKISKFGNRSEIDVFVKAHNAVEM